MVGTTQVTADQTRSQIDDLRICQRIYADVQPLQKPVFIDAQPEGLEEFNVLLRRKLVLAQRQQQNVDQPLSFGTILAARLMSRYRGDALLRRQRHRAATKSVPRQRIDTPKSIARLAQQRPVVNFPHPLALERVAATITVYKYSIKRGLIHL